MASPFRVFRKYQKTLLAVAGVVLMFVFVVGDSLFSYLSGGRNPQAGGDQDSKATAVQWDGGKLTNRQLSELVFRRRVLNDFLRKVEMAGRQPSYEAGVEPPELRVQPLLGPETPEQQVESSVVATKLLAEAATEAGMKISDATLVEYLNEIGRTRVSPAQMRALLNREGPGGSRMSIDYVIDALREEMLAHNYRASHGFSFVTVTPEQRWKDWLRVNDRVVIEAAAVPAEMYMPDVKEPTDAELTEFFDKYKNNEAFPQLYGNIELPSPTPGFRIPHKIDVQFIQANYEEFLTKAKAKITDEEIAKYYEAHKDLFPKMNVGLMEDKDAKKDAPKTDTPADKGNAKEDSNEGKPVDAEKKAEEPANKKTESPAKPESPPAPEGKKPDAKSSDEKKSSGTTSRNGIFRLAAFAEDVEKKDGKADKAAEKTGDASAAKGDAAETKAAAPAEKPAATPPAGTAEASKSAPAAPVDPAASAPKKPIEYQPLSEVKDEIRRSLAETMVAEELSKLMDGIDGPLQSAFEKWRGIQFSAAEKKEQPAPPKSLTDFAAIAQKDGLQSGQTGLKSFLQLREVPVGKSSVIDANRTLLSMLFQGKDLEMYQPVKTVDIDRNRYIAMKIGDTPGRVPTLAEVKPEVIKAWKNEQAAKLAKEHAEEFAKKTEEAKTPLAGFFADNKTIKVVRTDPFSELTGGDVGMVGGQLRQQPYRWSQPSEIVAAGPAFLRGVFNLKDGQVGVLINNDHSIAYVVRVVEHQPGLAELRSNYMAEPYPWQGEYFMTQMRHQEANNLEGDIKTRTNLKWERESDPIKGEQRDES